jgi:hypothetical protein
MAVTVRRAKLNSKYYRPNKISAKSLDNFINSDSICDILKPSNIKSSLFTNFVSDQAFKFKRAIYCELSRKFDCIYISDYYSDEGFEKTKKAVQEGRELIFSAPLFNPEDNTFGIPDIIARSDILNKIVSSPPNVPDGVFYVIIDVKWITLSMLTNRLHLSNSGNFKNFKTHLYVYNKALNNLQDCKFNRAYIIGKGWKYIKDGHDRSERWDALLAEVDFSDKDIEFKSLVSKAVEWRNFYSLNKRNMKLDDFYPNMKRDDVAYNQAKHEIAIKRGEITLIWNCGIKQRQKAFDKGVCSYHNEKCTAQLLGFSGHHAKIINNIIKINKPECRDKFYPKNIPNLAITTATTGKEFFVDVETLGSPVIKADKPFIYMIGVYSILDGYKCFHLPVITKEEEDKMIQNFTKYIHSESASPVLWHWGHIERTLWESN